MLLFLILYKLSRYFGFDAFRIYESMKTYRPENSSEDFLESTYWQAIWFQAAGINFGTSLYMMTLEPATGKQY